MMANVPDTLVAGFGNVLRGDDGFGVAVIERLRGETLPEHVRLLEIGTGGIRLAQELLDGYRRLVIVDAMARGEPPGTVYVRKVDAVTPAADADMHLAVPARALGLAAGIGALPDEILFVGCEPADTEELTLTLSPIVEQAVEIAVRHVRRLVGADAVAETGGGT